MVGLFDEKELLDPGKKRFVDYQLPLTELKLWEQFFEKQESDFYYQHFIDTTPWAQHRRKMYDKIVADPRLTAWYGPNGNEWTPELLTIKQRIEETCGIEFDCVLLNYYRDGNDSVAWHSDGLPASGKPHAIASITFGETRVFKVRPRTNKNSQLLEIPLTHGSFLLMGKTMQDHYEHHIAKTSRKIGPRINFTFRKV